MNNGEYKINKDIQTIKQENSKNAFFTTYLE